MAGIDTAREYFKHISSEDTLFKFLYEARRVLQQRQELELNVFGRIILKNGEKIEGVTDLGSIGDDGICVFNGWETYFVRENEIAAFGLYIKL